MGIGDTILKMFPKDFEEFVPVRMPWWKKIDFNNLKSKQGIILAASALIIILPGVYYYNKFVDLSRYTEMEQHQIDVMLQRRKDLSINLTKMVIDYAQHERTVFQYMVDKRSGSGGKMDMLENVLKQAGVGSLDQLKSGLSSSAMGKILALAEAYPDLKLNANFQVLMQGLIKSEDNIAERRMAYNEAASQFHAAVRHVPACFYAFVFGYRERMFHYADVDDDVRKFIVVAY
ncbi:MAG: LemA family protein [Candidatus Omnitrophica bacterium]|nr:LemA family protein [Candidatus Omnitrophota bacterium]